MCGVATDGVAASRMNPPTALSSAHVIVLYSALVVLGPLLFLLLRLRPLTESEVAALANKRRDRQVASYFDFARQPVASKRALKSAMESTGAFYSIDVSLAWCPSYTAGLLKYARTPESGLSWRLNVTEQC